MSDDQAKTNEDYRRTALYKNAKGVTDSIDAQANELRDLKLRVEKLEELVAVQAQTQFQVDHQIGVMWAKWMGNGPTG